MKINSIVCCLVALSALSLASCKIEGGYETKGYVTCTNEVQNFLQNYPDSVCFDSVLYWDVLSFELMKVEDGDGNEGFGRSMLCDTTYASGHKRETLPLFSVADTTGSSYSEIFMFYHQSPGSPVSDGIKFNAGSLENATCTAYCVYVNNTNYLANLVQFGMDGIPAFSQGDELVVTFTGKLNGTETKSVSKKLAFYDGNGLTYLHDWTLVDLTSIGQFTSMDVKLTSTRSDIPLYCCLDDLTVYVYAKSN